MHSKLLSHNGTITDPRLSFISDNNQVLVYRGWITSEGAYFTSHINAYKK